MVFMWTDTTAPGGGGTFLATDSIAHQAKLFARHPEGLNCVNHEMRDATAAYMAAEAAAAGKPLTAGGSMADLCSNFVELLGRAGDVALVHPWMLHRASGNATDRPRFITNTTVCLKDPMVLDRTDPAAFSPLERSVLHGLQAMPDTCIGKTGGGFPFTATGPRERRLANDFDDDTVLRTTP